MAASTERRYLDVRLRGRERPGRLPVPDGAAPRDELARFLNRQGPYAQVWVRLEGDEYVRYDLIESISLPHESD